LPSVSDIIAKKGRDVATVSRETCVLDAVKEMNNRRIGAVVVINENRVVGVFTERDLLNRVVAKQLDVTQVLVNDVMSTPVACCQLSTELTEAQGVMTKKRIRHLPVVEGDDLVGIISIGDLMARQVADQQNTIRYLNEYLYGRT
jgi:CBS domain-containing protein